MPRHFPALIALGLAACLLLPRSSAAQQAGSTKKPVTLDDVLNYRRPQAIEPNWAPNSEAFLYEKQGDIFLYHVAARKAEKWFTVEQLEKQAAEPAVSPDYGWQNRRVSSDSYQWFPDSRSLLAEVRGDLFIVHPNGKFDQITKTIIDEEDPKLSPDGHRILYRSKGNLFVIDIDTKQLKQLTTDGTPTLLNGQLDWVYPEELDLGTATWWSPDSKQIAYLQFEVSHEFVYPQVDLTARRARGEPERYPQAGTPNANVKLGRISPDGGPTTWMNIGETSGTLVARVAWLPDASAIAVERLTRIQDQLDLLFCDPASGTVRPVIHEQSKTWINLTDNLFFLKSKPEFLWTSERSGFRHLYRYSNKGEMLGQLTEGDWEVSSVAGIDEANGRISYLSSEASPLAAQLYSVSVAGGARTRVTTEEGDHDASVSPNGAYFTDRFSSAQEPPQMILKEAAGKQLAILQPADKKIQHEYDILPGEIVTMKASDGTPLYGRVTRPAGFQAGMKYPAIVSVYGGPGAQTVRDRWPGLSFNQFLAHRGYVIWELDNRGSRGRGHAFETPIFRELGTHEVEDQRTGVERLIAMGFVDPQRVGITGWSYGGYMTLRSMLLAPDMFRVGVAGAPVTDWHNYDTIYTERYMGLPEDNQAGYEASSNVKDAAKLEGKLLILHNIEDDNVLFQNTMQMANALERANKQFFMQIYPQKTHGVSGPLRRPLYEAMCDFFDAHLKTAAP